MKALDSIKSFGRKALVIGSSILTGLGVNCSIDNNVTDVLEIKLEGSKYVAKSILITNFLSYDEYKFVIEDSTGKKILGVYLPGSTKPSVLEIVDGDSSKFYQFGKETHYLIGNPSYRREETKWKHYKFYHYLHLAFF